MSTPSETVQDAADELFDKYLLPKVALTIILVASALGTWVSLRAASRPPLLTIVKWLNLVSFGTLTGGLVWKHMFVRPEEVYDEASDYCSRMYNRFDVFETVTSSVILISTLFLLATQYSTYPLTPRMLLGAVAVTVFGLVVLRYRDEQEPEKQYRSLRGTAVLSLSSIGILVVGVFDVVATNGSLSDVAVRTLHLSAFAVWLGGAVWNIFVAVPTGKRNPTPEMVRVAGQQLERFRWAVRMIIPTLLLTGAYQAYRILGFDIGSYVSTVTGVVVLAKAGFIVVLVGIFLTCPMWRACSPIDGVCDLDDIRGEETEVRGETEVEEG